MFVGVMMVSLQDCDALVMIPASSFTVPHCIVLDMI